MSEIRMFRARDEQVNEIHEATAKRVCARRSDYPETVYHAYINAQIQEAEARGAAAERERCIDIVANKAPDNDCTLPARDGMLLTGLAADIVEAIRSAEK